MSTYTSIKKLLLEMHSHTMKERDWNLSFILIRSWVQMEERKITQEV